MPVGGLEPTASWTRAKRDAKLRYTRQNCCGTRVCVLPRLAFSVLSLLFSWENGITFWRVGQRFFNCFVSRTIIVKFRIMDTISNTILIILSPPFSFIDSGELLWYFTSRGEDSYPRPCYPISFSAKLIKETIRFRIAVIKARVASRRSWLPLFFFLAMLFTPFPWLNYSTWLHELQ